MAKRQQITTPDTPLSDATLREWLAIFTPPSDAVGDVRVVYPLVRELIAVREKWRGKRLWERTRVCVAAQAASMQFQQWVPQRWLELFMDAYEAAEPAYRRGESAPTPQPTKEVMPTGTGDHGRHSSTTSRNESIPQSSPSATVATPQPTVSTDTAGALITRLRRIGIKGVAPVGTTTHEAADLIETLTKQSAAYYEMWLSEHQRANRAEAELAKARE